MMSFACPKCQMVLRAPEERAGAVTACPKCRQTLRVPSPAPAAPNPPAAPPSEPAWFFLQDGKRFGPASWAQLQEQARTGRLQPADGVWQAGMAGPVPAQTLPGLLPPPPAAPEQPPFWKRALREARAIGSVTLRLTARPFLALHGWWRGRSARQTALARKLALGQKAYEAQIGDKDLRIQIHGLGEQIHSAEVNKTATRQLTEQRRQLLLRLAEPLLAVPAAPAVAEAHARARAAEEAVQAHHEHMTARQRTYPSGPTAWRRAGIGYGVTAAIAAGVVWLLVLPGSSSSPEEAQGPEQARVQPRLPVTPVRGKNSSPDTQKRPPKKKPPLRDLSHEEIYATAAKSVALIRSNISSGTGFLVRPDILATNAHVVDSTLGSGLKIYFPSAGEAGKKPLSAELLYFDSRRDLAFLKIPAQRPPLEINAAYQFKPGQSITVIGNPSVAELTLRNAVTPGLMSTQSEIRGQNFFQLSISVNPGNSGGPVFDSKGQVIGIVTLKASKQEGIAFCIPAQDVIKGLAAVDKATPQARAAMIARHKLVVVYQRIGHVCIIYADGLRGYAEVLQKGMRGGRQPQFVIAQLQPQVNKKLKELDDLLEGIDETVKRFESDTVLPEATRKQIVDLWTTCQAMKQALAHPTPNPFLLAQRARQLGGKSKQQIKELSDALGVEEPE